MPWKCHGLAHGRERAKMSTIETKLVRNVRDRCRNCHGLPPPRTVEFCAGSLCRGDGVAAKGVHLPAVLDVPDEDLRAEDTSAIN